jgi:hypothetical protein
MISNGVKNNMLLENFTAQAEVLLHFVTKYLTRFVHHPCQRQHLKRQKWQQHISKAYQHGVRKRV